MENFVFGFYLGISLILAVGPQNIFVIEQGLKRNHIFLVCLICSVSDLIFIALGTATFNYFSKSNPIVDLILYLLLIIFLLNFIWNKLNYSSYLYSFNEEYSKEYIGKVVLKTLAFTYLNPHVYSDTIFIIGGFSRELMFCEKIFFVIGASTASFIYFFSLGYASSYFANFINNQRGWRLINIIVISSMVFLSIFICHKILIIMRSII